MFTFILIGDYEMQTNIILWTTKIHLFTQLLYQYDIA